MDFLIRRVSTVLALAMLAFFVWLGPAAGEQLTKASRVSFRGIGPVRIGMTVPEAERAVGARLSVDTLEEGSNCQDVSREDGKDVAYFMAIDGVIRRIDVLEPGILTVSGVGVGDTEETVKRVYGERLRIERHFYDPKGHYLIVDSPNG